MRILFACLAADGRVNPLTGSILLSLSHGVPIVGAGVREGKNDNNAHLRHHGLGVDLRTEGPTPRAVRRGIARVLVEPGFRRNAARIRDEIAAHRPFDIIDAGLATALETVS